MDQYNVPHSELLQSRLRDHKAESTRSRNQSPQNPPDRRLNLGRDDDIFFEEDPANRANKAALKRNSPAAPSAWRYDREPAKTRPTNNVASTTGATPRAMGAREMEDHIDKLSKQNFDLKMEVFHRREKIDQLERKLADYAQLEEDLTHTLDANEELVAALEVRDRAIDEAVVMITELEQKNRDLEEQLSNAKVAAAVRKAPVIDNSTVPSSPGRKSQKTPRKPKDRRSLRNSVSPDVSARMIKLANPQNEPEETLAPMPSFLKSNEPSTAVLRSMYLEGDSVVRPLPSQATLLSNVNPVGNPEYLDGLQSPGLSELSDSDLKSLYNNVEHAKEATQEAQETSRMKSQATQNANARVSKWVAERAVSPTKSNRSRKSLAPESDDYQSLDHVLKKTPDPAPVESAVKPSRGRQPLTQRPEKDSHTPPMPLNPVFGQNVFPPTPDTMITRPSNNSTTSFVPEKAPAEASSSAAREVPQQSQSNTLLTPTPRKLTTPSSFLPQEFDAYGSPPEESKMVPLESGGEYSDDALRGYSSDGSFTQGNNPTYSHRNQQSLAGTTVIGAPSIRDAPAPARRSPSMPKLVDNRPKPGVPEYPVLPHRTFGGGPRDRNYQGNPSAQATPTNMSYASLNRNRRPSNTPSINTLTHTQPVPLNSVHGGPLMPKNGIFPSPAAVATSPPTAKTTKSLAARTAAIRDRFLRRKTTPAPPLDPASAQAETPSARRSGSISRRFLFRRSSSEHGRVPPLPPTGESQYPFPAQGTNTMNSSFASSNGRTYNVNGTSSITLNSPPRRAKSEKHRPTGSMTGQSDRSVFSSSSSRLNGPVTPDGYSNATAMAYGTTPPGAGYYAARQRRPSFNGRASSGSRSNTDIPPVADTPTDALRWGSDPESAGKQSKWRFGSRSRSSSRTKEPTLGTLASHDGTAAGRRA